MGLMSYEMLSSLGCELSSRLFVCNVQNQIGFDLCLKYVNLITSVFFLTKYFRIFVIRQSALWSVKVHHDRGGALCRDTRWCTIMPEYVP